MALAQGEARRRGIDTKGDLGGDMTLHRLLIEGEGWQLVAEGLGFADGPLSDAEGNFYFSDMKATAASSKSRPTGRRRSSPMSR